MSADNYFITDQNAVYFLTFTVQSMKYLKAEKNGCFIVLNLLANLITG